MARSHSPLKSLAALLDRSAAAVALFDHQRRLVYASAACAAVLGVDLATLLGRKAVYSSEPQADAACAALARIAPPPEAFEGRSSTAELPRAGADGPPLVARYLPMPTAGDDIAVLVIVAPGDSEAAPQRVSASSDWHVVLAKLRASLPANLHTEYLAGDSPEMVRLREQVQVAAASKARIVVVGPRGSGAHEIATRIHALGGGRNEGLIALNCQMQDAETLQAAIRALSRKRNDAPPAMVLRDVGLLPAAAQQELLGFLQLPGFEIRTLCTSRWPLARLVKKGSFSAELAALLGTLELRAPPLRDRPEDVPLLGQWFLEQANAAGGRQLSGFVPEAVERLVAYDWPENVEELGRIVGEACRGAVGPWVIASDLPERLHSNWSSLAWPRADAEAIDLDAFLCDVEKDLLARALHQARGNKSEAARLLNVSRPRLLRRMLQLGLSTKEESIDFQPLDDAPPLGDAS